MGQCYSGYTRNLARVAQIATICILVFALLSACVLQPASASSAGVGITVAGGAVGTGGIAAFGALGGALMPTLGVIGAVLLGCGIDTYITEQSAAQGITRAKYLENSLRQWTSERGGSFDDLIGTIADAIHVSPLGQISMTAAGGALIYQFGNWLFDKDLVEEAPSVSGSESVSMGEFSLHAVASGEMLQYLGGPYTTSSLSSFYWSDVQVSPLYSIILNFSANRPAVLCYIYPDTYTISYDSFKMYNQNGARINVFGDGIGTSYNLGNGYKIIPDIYWKNCDIPAVPSYDISITQFVSAVTGLPLGSDVPLPSDDVFTGSEQDWTDNRDLLRPGEDNVLVIDNAPDLIGGAAEELAAGDYVISVPDYLAALADAYEQARVAEASIPLTLTDTATGTLVDTQVVIAEPYADTYVSTDSSTDHTGSGGKLVDADGMSGDDSVEALRGVSFKDFFPFCIPWDMYRVIMLLDAEPRAPVYTAEWDSQYLDEPITLNINLTPWDEVAEIWRICYRIMFICGLAIESRKIIKV